MILARPAREKSLAVKKHDALLVRSDSPGGEREDGHVPLLRYDFDRAVVKAVEAATGSPVVRNIAGRSTHATPHVTVARQPMNPVRHGEVGCQEAVDVDR